MTCALCVSFIRNTPFGQGKMKKKTKKTRALYVAWVFGLYEKHPSF